MTIASDPAADFAAPCAGKSPVAPWRLYLLRAGYLLTAASMGLQMWSTYTSRLSRATNEADTHKARANPLHDTRCTLPRAELPIRQAA